MTAAPDLVVDVYEEIVALANSWCPEYDGRADVRVEVVRSPGASWCARVRMEGRELVFVSSWPTATAAVYRLRDMIRREVARRRAKDESEESLEAELEASIEMAQWQKQLAARVAAERKAK